MDTIPRDIIRGRNILLTSGSVAKMWFISGEDYAQQVINALDVPQTRQEYIIQGPEAYTWDEAAAIIRASHSKKMRVMKAPIGMLKVFGKFNRFMDYGYHICEALNKHPEKFESENTWEILGKPGTTLRDFVRGL